MGRLYPVICKLSRKSIADLVVIENDASHAPWSEQLIAQEFSNNISTIFGARIGGRLCGFLVAHVFVEEIHILNIAVLTSKQGKGIGRQLLEYALRDFYDEGVRWGHLEVRKSNHRARTLYESLGFTEVGVRERYYSDNGEDAFVMSLNLRHFVDQYGADESAVGNM